MRVLEEISLAIFGAVIVPLIVLCLDYVSRDDLHSLTDVKKLAGGDLCLLALGAAGAVFLDPKIQGALGLSAGIVSFIVALLILILRFLCRRFATKGTRQAIDNGIKCGLASIFIVVFIIVYGHYF